MRFLINDDHTLTMAAAFTSNAFYKDQYIVGLEYNLKNYVMLRGAYTYEDGITTTSVYNCFEQV